MWMGPELYSKCGAFVCMLNFFFYIFTKRYRRTKIDFLLLYFFFLLVLEKLNKNFRI